MAESTVRTTMTQMQQLINQAIYVKSLFAPKSNQRARQ